LELNDRFIFFTVSELPPVMVETDMDTQTVSNIFCFRSYFIRLEK